MKKIKIAILIVILAVSIITLTGCQNEAKKYTAEEVYEKLKEKNQNIGRVVVYSEETDINELLGRPNQYTSKVTFEDLRVPQTNKNLDPEYFSQEEINEPQGGTIEVFESEEDMKKRKEYVEAVTSSMSVFVEYSYSDGVYLLRLDKSLTPAQAKEYEDLFYNIIREMN